MSGKDLNTKVSQETNADSGFVSGRIDGECSEESNVDSGFVSASVGALDSGDLGAQTDNSSDVRRSSHRSSGSVQSGIDSCTQSILHLELKDFEEPTTELSRRTESRHAASEGRPPLTALFQQDADGDTNLHIAAARGCEKSVAVLIKICPDKAFLDIQNDHRHTALHLAVMGGYPVVTKMLVLGGASLALRDVCGKTPVHIAAETGDVDCLTALLAPVLEQPERNLKDILHQRDHNGQTCVHAAATAGHVRTLQTLVYFNADINVTEGLAGWTALHIAACRGDARVAQYLLQECPAVDRGARDNAGRTARRLAARAWPRSALAGLFHASPTDDDDSSDDDDYDSEGETLFEQLRSSMSPINVA